VVKKQGLKKQKRRFVIPTILEYLHSFAFDLVVKVGRLRYDEYRQLGEVHLLQLKVMIP
jgi:hypothetical protein